MCKLPPTTAAVPDSRDAGRAKLFPLAAHMHSTLIYRTRHPSHPLFIRAVQLRQNASGEMATALVDWSPRRRARGGAVACAAVARIHPRIGRASSFQSHGQLTLRRSLRPF